MIKVVIADDEEKVCKLICNLIDWQSINMEIVGTAHNGIEALELVKTLKPNVVITDIRMPGYDGLELISFIKQTDLDVDCIIISGYRHFEYAKNAIKYGVVDYLLKPIKKDELMSTLIKINEKFRLRTEQLTNEEQLKMRIQNDIDKLRSGLFVEILVQKKCSVENLTLSAINENYHFQFQEGYFQVAIIKVDCGFEEGYNSSIALLQDKITQILNVNVRDKCFDMEIYFDDSMGYCILNYKKDDRKIIRKQLRLVLDELLVQKNIFEQVEFTIGIGSFIEDTAQLAHSFKTAQIAIEQRFLIGKGKLIDEIKIIDTQHITNKLLAELNKSMGVALEVLDKEGVLKSIAFLRTSIQEMPDLSGVEIIKLARETCKIYLTLLQSNQLALGDADRFYENFSLYVSRCGSLQEVFGYLCICIEESLNQIIKDKKQVDTKPIRMAKNIFNKII